MAKETKNKTHIFLKLRRGLIGKPESARLTVRGLGLKRIGSTSLLNDTPAIRGMVVKVQHLVDVEVREGALKKASARTKNKAAANSKSA